MFFRGIFGKPDFRRIVRKNPESYREYGTGIFSGEAAKDGQDKNFIEKHHTPEAQATIRHNNAIRCAWVGFGITTIWFLCGATPGIYWKDAGELTTAAFVLGVPHPTGFPTYMVLAKLATLFPFGNIAFRVTVLSVVCAAVAVGACVYGVVRMLETAPDTQRPQWFSWFATILVSGLLISSPTFALHATTAEVYAPLAMGIGLAFSGFVVAIQQSEKVYLRRSLYLTCGFGVGTHVLAVPIFTVLVGLVVVNLLGTRVRRRWLVQDLPFLGMGVVVAVLVYAYLPLAASADPFWNWGNPDTVDRWVAHVSGASIRLAFAETMGQQSWAATWIWVQSYWAQIWEGAGWLVFAALLGTVGAWFSHQRWALGALLLVWMVDLVFSVWINPMGIVDRQTAVPSILVLAILSSFGATWAIVQVGVRFPRSTTLKLILPTFVLVLLVLPTVQSTTKTARGNDYYAELHGHTVLQQVAPGGRLFVGSDDVSAVVAYLVGVDGARPDIAVVFVSHIYDHNAVNHWQRLYPEQIPEEAVRLSEQAAVSGRWMYTDAQRQILARLFTVPERHAPVVWELGDPAFDPLIRAQLRPGFPLFFSGPVDHAPSGTEQYALTDTIQQISRWEQWSSAPTEESANVLAETLRQTALWFAQRNELTESSRILLESVKVSPDYDRSLGNLGAVWDRMGDLDAAISVTERATQLRPWVAKTRVNLSRMLVRKGELDRAFAAATEALPLAREAPDIANLHVELGKIALLRSDIVKARFHAQQALRTIPGHPGAVEVQQKLRSLSTTPH